MIGNDGGASVSPGPWRPADEAGAHCLTKRAFGITEPCGPFRAWIRRPVGRSRTARASELGTPRDRPSVPWSCRSTPFARTRALHGIVTTGGDEALRAYEQLRQELQRADSLVARLRRLLHDDLLRPDSNAIAKTLGVSERTLQRRLGEVDTSFTEKLTSARIDRAKALMEGTGDSVTPIALAVGFASLEQFSRTFRARVGRTPTEYRGRPVGRPNRSLGASAPVVGAARQASGPWLVRVGAWTQDDTDSTPQLRHSPSRRQRVVARTRRARHRTP